MGLLIKNGLLVNVFPPFLKKADLLAENGKIRKISPGIKSRGARMIDARGKWIVPGIIDMHVHTRDPGDPQSETLETAAAAAAKGGITSFLAMPNTVPPVDSTEILGRLLKKASKLSINVLFAACVTKKRRGKEATDFPALKKAGAAAFSDDGSPTLNPEILRDFLLMSKKTGIPVLEHCEEPSISGKGVFGEKAARRFGLPAIARESEIYAVVRNLFLSASTDSPVHLQHISCAESVLLIRTAKKAGIKVTCETCPHYFSLSEDDIPGPQADFKMNPPLRGKADRAEILKGMEDGTIDAVVSDHAPHSKRKKKRDIRRAPFGIIGLETLLPLTFTETMTKKKFRPESLPRLLCANPAKILGLGRKGALKENADADICVLDPETEKKVFAPFKSMSSNSPFAGKKLRGWPVLTIKGGKAVYGENL